jgi:translation elongation factor EF-Tu-like GTPase
VDVTPHSSTASVPTLPRTTDATGALQPEAGEMVMPGDNVKIVVQLICPDLPGRRAALHLLFVRER